MSYSPPRLPTDQDITLSLSPSKALAHQQTTTAWSCVTRWLTPLFTPNPVPPFERNSATLTYLQSLMDANIRANHRQRLLHKARMEQLRKYEEYGAATKVIPAKVLLSDMKASLRQEAKANLEAMAKASVALTCMPPSEPTSEGSENDATMVMGKRIVEVTQELFRLQDEVEELFSLKRRFDNERKTTEEEVLKLREDVRHVEDEDLDSQTTGPVTDSASARIPLGTLLTQTSQFHTSTKQLTPKIKEYQDRISALNRSSEVQRQREGDTSIEEVQRREGVLQRKSVEIEKLEARLREYHGLPPDLEASREELQRAQGELEEWRRRREAAFETLSEG